MLPTCFKEIVELIIYYNITIYYLQSGYPCFFELCLSDSTYQIVYVIKNDHLHTYRINKTQFSVKHCLYMQSLYLGCTGNHLFSWDFWQHLKLKFCVSESEINGRWGWRNIKATWSDTNLGCGWCLCSYYPNFYCFGEDYPQTWNGMKWW